jgi:hypothetical protein
LSTIITAQSGSGHKRSCNGTCHNAKHDKCNCICQGRFHGAAHRAGGVTQAVEDFWDEALRNIEAQGLKVIKAEAKVELPLKV